MKKIVSVFITCFALSFSIMGCESDKMKYQREIVLEYQGYTPEMGMSVFLGGAEDPIGSVVFVGEKPGYIFTLLEFEEPLLMAISSLFIGPSDTASTEGSEDTLIRVVPSKMKTDPYTYISIVLEKD